MGSRQSLVVNVRNYRVVSHNAIRFLTIQGTSYAPTGGHKKIAMTSGYRGDQYISVGTFLVISSGDANHPFCLPEVVSPSLFIRIGSIALGMPFRRSCYWQKFSSVVVSRRRRQHNYGRAITSERQVDSPTQFAA